MGIKRAQNSSSNTARLRNDPWQAEPRAAPLPLYWWDPLLISTIAYGIQRDRRVFLASYPKSASEESEYTPPNASNGLQTTTNLWLFDPPHVSLRIRLIPISSEVPWKQTILSNRGKKMASLFLRRRLSASLVSRYVLKGTALKTFICFFERSIVVLFGCKENNSKWKCWPCEPRPKQEC